MKKILARTNSENVNKHINRYGDSALHYAITNQSKTVVEELLKHKDVDVNRKNKRNCTSLHLASKWKEIPVDLFKKILKKSTYVNAQDEDGNTALHVAVLNESTTAIKELLKRTDVDVNVRCIDNQTALHFAAKWTHMPIHYFKEILKKPTDVNAQDQDGQTALHYAILENSKTAVEELLKHKELDVNLKNRDSSTALHFASMWEDIPIDLCRIILEKSTDVNAQDEDG
ncbi:hypothetical protein DAPPUDRAFT_53225 [Daphnia pulex]|uniref:Uncharacterized protein n=1 Tax=Daphnia pulex TaxID=6669 RepID=E9GPG2_DAPPU|nr:hypothetical protein DAPPUDRAFT_53225 [Daphnia pulex]|eukprot:EFX78686.1 hypothetical protein DAPPUDRAFT_53225 [Daphnia pulex]